MHLTMEIIQNAKGQFEGMIKVQDQPAVAFSGTLELLKVLQDISQEASDTETLLP